MDAWSTHDANGGLARDADHVGDGEGAAVEDYRVGMAGSVGRGAGQRT